MASSARASTSSILGKIQTMQESILVVEPTGRPAGHKKDSEIIERGETSHSSSHAVTRVVLKTAAGDIPCFLKSNPDNAEISELEATAANFSRVLAPSYAPRTFVIYDEYSGKTIGVASEEIRNFKTLTEDALKESDLDVSFLQKKSISIDNVEKLDEELQVLEENAFSLEKQLKKLKSDEIIAKLDEPVVVELEQELKQEEDEEEIDDDYVVVESASPLTPNFHSDLKKQKLKNDQAISKLITEAKLTPAEVERYRIVKGLGIGLTISYIFMENDLHRNNMSKYGKRVDFDMMLHSILYDFKDKDYFERIFGFRQPDESTVAITRRDIVNFPVLQDYKPHYWPTLPPQIIASLKRVFNYLNDYTKADNELFKKLKNNPVFMHHEYATFARYLLTTPNIYEEVACRNLRERYEYTKKSLLEFVVDQQASRIDQFQRVLLEIESFCSFFTKYHEKISEKLLKDLEAEAKVYASSEMKTDLTGKIGHAISVEMKADTDASEESDAEASEETNSESSQEMKTEASQNAEVNHAAEIQNACHGLLVKIRKTSATTKPSGSHPGASQPYAKSVTITHATSRACS